MIQFLLTQIAKLKAVVSAQSTQTITGTFAASEGFSETIAYPSGYDKDNTIVLSINVNNGNNWRYGVGMANSEDQERTFVDLITGGIRAYTTQSLLFGCDFRITIMKNP